MRVQVEEGRQAQGVAAAPAAAPPPQQVQPHKLRRQGELPERLAAILEVERSPSPAAQARAGTSSRAVCSQLCQQAIGCRTRGLQLGLAAACFIQCPTQRATIL